MIDITAIPGGDWLRWNDRQCHANPADRTGGDGLLAEGSEGRVYQGLVPYRVETLSEISIPRTRTKIMLIVGDPERAFDYAGIQPLRSALFALPSVRLITARSRLNCL